MPFIEYAKDGVTVVGQFENQQFNDKGKSKNLAWVDERLSNEKTVQEKIIDLERTITQRRVREAVLGIDDGWLYNINDKIVQLRNKL